MIAVTDLPLGVMGGARRAEFLRVWDYQCRLARYLGDRFPNYKILSYGHSGPVPGKLHIKLCRPDQ